MLTVLHADEWYEKLGWLGAKPEQYEQFTLIQANSVQLWIAILT